MFRAPMDGPRDDADKIFDTFTTYILFDVRTHARTHARMHARMYPAGRARCVRLTPRAIINTGSRPRERLKFNVIYYFLIYPNETFYADIFDAPGPPSSSPPGRSLEGLGDASVCA